MARCISCGTEIPDGSEYCAECMSKLNTAKDSESYLDSLLNAVMTEEPERREIVYPKKEASSLVSAPVNKQPEPRKEKEPEVESAAEKTAPMEDALGVFFDADTELPDLKSYNIFENVDEHSVDRLLAADLGFWDLEDEEDFEEDYEEAYEEQAMDVSDSEVGDIADLFSMLEDERGAEAPEEIELKETEVISAAEFDEASDAFNGVVELPEEDAPLPDFADLFGGTETENSEEIGPAEVPGEEKVPDFGDFADLFGDTESNSADAEEEAVPVSEFDDMSDFFGDMFEFGAEPEELEEEPEDTVADSAMAAMEFAGVELPSETEETEETEVEEGRKAKKGQGRLAALYHKLFDNVKVDPSKIKPQPTKEEIEAKKREKAEEKARNKEEKEALLAEKKEQEKQVKLEKQRAAKEVKAEKKARKLEEAKLLLEEMEGTRINRAGASIVFIFFAMIAVVIIVGTSIFSYSLSIRNAEYEFNRDEYTLAYNEIYGLEIKDEDIVLYDRIMTVMYVQKQLNSYYNYYGLDDKPKALDSLLKGLQRYEKYIELAVELDVDSDLDSVRKKILAEISASFMLTEQEAMEIIQSDSQVEYSKKVYDAVDALE